MKTKAKYFIKSNLIIVLLCLFISFIFTLLITNSILEPNIGTIITKILSAIAFLVGSMYLGRKIKNKGYLLGIISIIIYLIAVLCFSISKYEISTIDVVVRCICLFAGSIIGVNSAKN